MANRKITLKDSTGTNNLYPATFTSQVFDENENNLDILLSDLELTAGTGIDITNNTITNKFVALPSGTNLNSVNYEFSGYVLSPTNAPVSGNGHLVSQGWNSAGTYGFQFWNKYNEAELYYRHCTNGTWSNWGKILSSVNQATNVNAFDDATPGDAGFGIVWGIFSNIAYLSFDTSWIRLQFKISSTAIQARLKYGGSTPTTWKDIYTR